ncbi:MAG: 1-acyl-sn-glycerol-3-phosphate acyltransferase [Verrucomicrobia bacterium]|nr:1-acyl-sn-glycerol-3-phosphate acyltransferase [Verrucomicrobiota bacterium]MBI3866988.1 1-acyl-sn-glycerol-3-phosphate acyltransferase [Verrucomicrobiota bacterium]
MKLDPRKSTWVYAIVWHLCRALFKVFFRVRYHYGAPLPLEGPVILAANHASYLDPPLVGSGLARPVNYLARDTLFKHAAFNFFLKRLLCVPVDRDGAGAAGLKGIFDRLSGGGMILLFPEGTRTPDGKLLPARAGVGLAVIKSGAPVIPVRVFGTFEAYGRNARFPRPRRIAVKYGAPMRLDDLRDEATTCSKPRVKEIYQEVADRIMSQISALRPDEQ